MSKCPNLARLAKTPLYTHVHFRRQNPGSPADLYLYQPQINHSGILDPSHPAARTPHKYFPNIQTTYFRLRAFPNALLVPHPDSTGSPSWPRIDSWSDRVTRASDLRKRLHMGHVPGLEPSQAMEFSNFLDWVSSPNLIPHPGHSIPMTLYFSIGKARTHKHAVKRRRLRTKFQEAINLVVTRGAQAKDTAAGVKELVFDQEVVQNRGSKWILPDWAYLCYPTPSLFLAPYADLVQATSMALEHIWASGMRLEKSWAEAEMRDQLGLPPSKSNLGPRRKTQARRTDASKPIRRLATSDSTSSRPEEPLVR